MNIFNIMNIIIILFVSNENTNEYLHLHLALQYYNVPSFHRNNLVHHMIYLYFLHHNSQYNNHPHKYHLHIHHHYLEFHLSQYLNYHSFLINIFFII